MPDTLMRQAEVDMTAIELTAKRLADAKRVLESELQRADQKLAKVREECGERLKAAALAVSSQEAELRDLARRAPALFQKPQSVEFDGVRVGWRKGKGRLELPAADVLIKRINAQLTLKQKQSVLKVKITVLKGPLAKLSGEILKKLGVNLTAAAQEPFVSYPKSATEKLVDWWLKPLPDLAADETE